MKNQVLSVQSISCSLLFAFAAVASCVALGHEKARFVSCPYADHGRALTTGVPYVELFVQGRLPDSLRLGARR